jgi:hypothetical protein
MAHFDISGVDLSSSARSMVSTCGMCTVHGTCILMKAKQNIFKYMNLHVT